jgi:hypothetical protein
MDTYYTALLALATIPYPISALRTTRAPCPAYCTCYTYEEAAPDGEVGTWPGGRAEAHYGQRRRDARLCAR